MGDAPALTLAPSIVTKPEGNQKADFIRRRPLPLIRGAPLCGPSRSISRDSFTLAASQLDRETGTVVWPAALQAAEYDGCRQTVDVIFDDCVGTGSWADGDRAEVVRCVRDALEAVRRNRAIVSPAAYLAAAKFLCGIKHEAEYPIAVEPIDGDKWPRTTIADR